MDTITTLQLRDAFRDAILAITPTFEPLRSIKWSYCPGIRRQGRAASLEGLGTRNFDLIFGVGRPSYLWYGAGESYVATLRIAVSYSGIEPEIAEHMVTADAVDLRRALYALRDPTLSGFVGFGNAAEFEPTSDKSDDKDNRYLEFATEIHWHQATETY